MLNIDLKSLISKLNETCRSTLEDAAGLCLSRTHYDVDLEHWFLKLLETNNTDFHKVLQYFEANPSRLQQDLTGNLDQFKSGNARTPAFSPRIPDLIQKAWSVASINFDAAKIRSGHLTLALLANDEFARLAKEASEEFKLISVEALQNDLYKIVAGSDEAGPRCAPPARQTGRDPAAR